MTELARLAGKRALVTGGSPRLGYVSYQQESQPLTTRCQ
jgi:hypothetical protein